MPSSKANAARRNCGASSYNEGPQIPHNYENSIFPLTITDRISNATIRDKARADLESALQVQPWHTDIMVNMSRAELEKAIDVNESVACLTDYITGVAQRKGGAIDARQVAVHRQHEQGFQEHKNSCVRHLEMAIQSRGSTVATFVEAAKIRAALPLREATLDATEHKSGSNFSAGERQALAMGRAVLHSKRIIVMDEPTANIDSQTDKLLQEMLREKFKGKTLLCVAHRLGTVIEMDRVVVMANGKVAEFAAPADLLDDKTSKFSVMVDATGPSSAASLRSAAAKTFRRAGKLAILAARLNSRDETAQVLEESALHDAGEAESALAQEVEKQKP